MAITNDEYEELESIINCASEHFNKISAWEEQFILDIDDKFKKHEHRIMLSDKQWKVLRKIYDACQD